MLDPDEEDGVRPEVAEEFAALVGALNESPMAKRALLIDKKAEGYWSRIIERGARSFENYLIAKMTQEGYHNDYLANVTPENEFSRNAERYPYLGKKKWRR
jgi:Large polyvalent protein-associated domain 1